MYLFQNEAFLHHQGQPRIVSQQFGLTNVQLAWYVKDHLATSPLKAPFGSIFFSGPIPVLTDLISFIRSWEEQVKQEGLSQISVTHHADFYQPALTPVWETALEASGFQVAFEDSNFHLELKSGFRPQLHRSERWKLNKLLREGYRFQKISPPDWDMAFPILLESRLRKGYLLSMTRAELEMVFQKFPEHYHLYGVFWEKQLVAVSVVISLGEGIDYLFYTADLEAHRKRSPVVLLHQGIFESSEIRRQHFLDLGTASLKGVLNKGLAQFKRNLGGQVSLKKTWIKILQ